jgi:para-nitrobenzyl esterase
MILLRALTVALLPIGLLATPAAASPPGGGVVRTDQGLVRGVSAGGVQSFLGMPYAAPPVGARRWAPPQPAAGWSGVRDATAFGNRCPALASTNGARSETEDCLFVNVQRPAGTRAGARLPVFVFIHGGGLTNGSSNQMNMDKIVRESGVIGVTMNYRLGVFGFLGHPALTAERGESGNYGFQDQQAALRWVRRNIAAFGGAPSRVTIGGESAGGWSVCSHLVAPGSRGLFAAAMIQSGSCATQTQAQAESAGTAFATSVGCGTAACLRALPASTLLDASGSFQSRIVSGTPTLPVDPAVAVRDGHFARVPVVNGANRDEGRTFSQGFIGAGQADYLAFVRSTFGPNADAVLARYPWPARSDRFTAAYLVGAVFTDSGLLTGIGGCGTRGLSDALSRWTPTYFYEFDHRTGPGLTPIPGYVWGAGHAAELAYLWPSFDNGTPIAPLFDAAERRLAHEMVRDWTTFVRGHRPWPAYHPRGPILSLRAGGQSRLISTATFSAEHQCAFWSSLTPA